MHFSINDEIITIHQLQTEGKSINLEASGWVDFNNETIDVNVELIGLKDYSKIISKIPLAGYAILGGDGSLSTSLEITGNRKQPDIKTNLAKDIGMTPFNIIKRAIKWPFRTFKKIRKYNLQHEQED